MLVLNIFLPVRCKENVEGTNCDRCKPATFGLSQDSQQGIFLFLFYARADVHE